MPPIRTRNKNVLALTDKANYVELCLGLTRLTIPKLLMHSLQTRIHLDFNFSFIFAPQWTISYLVHKKALKDSKMNNGF